jgi:D-methionine transport system permease protein
VNSDLSDLLLTASGETFFMLFFTAFFGLLLGLPLGVILTVTGKGHIMERYRENRAIGFIVNAVRSFPSIILIVVLLPLARFLVGTTLGMTAALVPLSICSAPFIARIIESALKEVDRGKVEASLAMGATVFDSIVKVLIPEALPSLIRGATIAVITILELTAIAGAIGAGGLGSLAIRYGYQRFRDDVMFATVAMLVILVQMIQFTGETIARFISKRRHIYE